MASSGQFVVGDQLAVTRSATVTWRTLVPGVDCGGHQTDQGVRLAGGTADARFACARIHSRLTGSRTMWA